MGSAAAGAVVAAAQVALELASDRLAARLGQLGGVLGVLELADVLRDLGVLLGQLVDAVLPRPCVLRQVAERHRHVEQLLDAAQQGERRLGGGRLPHVVRHRRPQRETGNPGPGRAVLQDADDAGRPLVRRGLEGEALHELFVVAGRGHRDGPGVRDVGQQGPERDHGGHVELPRVADDLCGVGLPSHRRLDAADEDDVPLGPRRPRPVQPRGRPGDGPPAVLVERGHRTVDLEVVVVLGVELRDRCRVPDPAEVAHRAARGLAGVVPALEGRDQHRVAQRRHGRQLAHGSSLRRRAPPLTAYGSSPVRCRQWGPEVHPSAPRLVRMSSRSDILRRTLAQRVVVADGAMGTMLQAADPSLDDFQGHEGCNEVLNVTRPDIVRSVHDAYLAVGVDCVETNTFGANLGNLGEYGIEGRIRELSRAGAAIAREAADAWSTTDQPRFVLGSVGPGTKLPSLGHTTFAALRDAYGEEVAGLVEGGADAVLVETAQDLLQAKAAIVGAQRAIVAAGADIPVFAQVTVESTGTMLVGSEIGAALTTLEALGVDGIGLNCATGPAEMSEHLRHLSKHSRVPVTCMPNAGLPMLTRDGASYPLTPEELADAHDAFTSEFGLSLVGGCCGTTPAHLDAVVRRVGGRAVRSRRPRPEPGVASIYQHVPFRQDTTYLSIGERTNANGSKAFREAMLARRWDECVAIARNQTRDGAHLLDVCIDYVGRDGVADMNEVVGRLPTRAPPPLPLVLDSTEPAVIEAGLELVGGRAVVNSVNFEDGEGPGTRFDRIMPVV